MRGERVLTRGPNGGEDLLVPRPWRADQTHNVGMDVLEDSVVDGAVPRCRRDAEFERGRLAQQSVMRLCDGGEWFEVHAPMRTTRSRERKTPTFWAGSVSTSATNPAQNRE